MIKREVNERHAMYSLITENVELGKFHHIEGYIWLGILIRSYNEKTDWFYQPQLIEREINIMHESSILLPVGFNLEAKYKALYTKTPPEGPGALEGNIMMDYGIMSECEHQPTHSGGFFWHESVCYASGEWSVWYSPR